MSPKQIEELKRDLRNCAVQPAVGIDDPGYQAHIRLLGMFCRAIVYIEELEADARRWRAMLRAPEYASDKIKGPMHSLLANICICDEENINEAADRLADLMESEHAPS